MRKQIQDIHKASHLFGYFEMFIQVYLCIIQLFQCLYKSLGYIPKCIDVYIDVHISMVTTI